MYQRAYFNYVQTKGISRQIQCNRCNSQDRSKRMEKDVCPSVRRKWKWLPEYRFYLIILFMHNSESEKWQQAWRTSLSSSAGEEQEFKIILSDVEEVWRTTCSTQTNQKGNFQTQRSVLRCIGDSKESKCVTGQKDDLAVKGTCWSCKDWGLILSTCVCL